MRKRNFYNLSDLFPLQYIYRSTDMNDYSRGSVPSSRTWPSSLPCLTMKRQGSLHLSTSHPAQNPRIPQPFHLKSSRNFVGRLSYGIHVQVYQVSTVSQCQHLDRRPAGMAFFHRKLDTVISDALLLNGASTTVLYLHRFRALGLRASRTQLAYAQGASLSELL